jgi:hypothetical protein
VVIPSHLNLIKKLQVDQTAMVTFFFFFQKSKILF